MFSLLNDSNKTNRKQNFSIRPFFQLPFVLLFLICFSAKTMAQNCPDNLIQNPGVESGLSNWAGGGTISTDAHTGSNAINVCQSGYARQTTAATVGSTYTLTFWAKNSASSVPTFGRVKFLTSSWQPISEELVAVTSTAYSEYSVENTAPPNTAWVEISVRKSASGSGCTVVDDFCLNTSGGGNNGGGNNGGGNNGTCGNNVLDNPGFENTFDEWNGTSLAISTTTASGSQALKLCQNADARQTVPYTAGNELTLLFSARDEGAGTTMVAYIKYLSASWQPLVTEFENISAGISYSEFSFSKAPPAGTAHVQIGFIKNSPNCILIDDVCLSEGGVTSGSCSFVKTYLPYELVSNTYVLSPMSKIGNNLTTWFHPNQFGAAPQATSMTADLSGNFIEQSVTPLPGSFINYSTTIQNADGDYVQVGNEGDVPFFTKTNKDGSEAWSTTVTEFTQNITDGRLLVRSLVADGTGYIGAFGNSDQNFLPPNQGEIVLIKVDANGQYLWQKTVPGLAIRYPDVQIFALTANAIYASVTTDTGYKVYKLNRSNGNFIWATPSYFDATFGYKNGQVNNDGEVSVIYYNGSTNSGLANNTTYLVRFNGTNGNFIGSLEKVNNLVGSEERSFVFGHYRPTMVAWLSLLALVPYFQALPIT